ncbi:hypothetical protein [Nitrososphaeria virus YSH_1032793]|uniref:Uncharacterized protein n=1 Tax=Nitrososphaeria virus YSH_1032793 TaxID=3071320 RepID=A0A976UBC8_9CAUD|nr:hypothetical protein QKV91_gp52 [Yangshan Harbor Nitrososphaeria virus]UVF62256.1 hypothetical protein [Nitrososphaeria virus YSH_1032793]
MNRIFSKLPRIPILSEECAMGRCDMCNGKTMTGYEQICECKHCHIQ